MKASHLRPKPRKYRKKTQDRRQNTFLLDPVMHTQSINDSSSNRMVKVVINVGFGGVLVPTDVSRTGCLRAALHLISTLWLFGLVPSLQEIFKTGLLHTKCAVKGACCVQEAVESESALLAKCVYTYERFDSGFKLLWM